MEKMPLIRPSRCPHNNIVGYCVDCLREENARLRACSTLLEREREEARERARVYERDKQAAEAKLAKVVEALEAMVIVMESGQPCYRTGNGIPQGMPRKVERVVRAAIAAAKEE